MTPQRIPIYLLTGFLGSGKTSLLKQWLREDMLSKAALIINELGEVGLDNQLLTAATESQSLLANACVCCTGLLGLSQALEEIFWARLERRMPRFPNVVIETTGLANPGPILETLQGNELLQERYTWGGTITCLSAPTAQAVLRTHIEARAQLQEANVCIITKTDQVSSQALEALRLRLSEELRESNPNCTFLNSFNSNLSANDVMQALMENQQGRASHQRGGEKGAGHQLAHGHEVDHHHPPEHEHGHEHEHEHGHEHAHEHRHHAQAFWWPLSHSDSKPLSLAQLLLHIEQLQQLLGTALLRLKGRLDTDQGKHWVQMAPFDPTPTVTQDLTGTPSIKLGEKTPPMGLTVIVGPMSELQENAMLQLIGPTHHPHA